MATMPFMSTAPRPVDVAVGDVGGERVVGPALGRGGHDIEVREQQERVAAGAVAAQADVDGATAGDGLDDLRRQSERPRGGRRW